MHPYLLENWNRKNVYPHMGFQEIYGGKDMTETDTVRWAISDEADYKEIIHYYENKTGENLFVFNVTLQNHGSYVGEWDNFEETVDLSHLGDFPEAEEYLSLIELSDRALEQLIGYFSQVEEPTLICVFGDHLPVIEQGYYDKLFGKTLYELTGEENLGRYETPFLIWANYDLEESQDEMVSANFLRARIKACSGLEMTDMDRFLSYVSEQYPVITPYGIIDKDGNYYNDLENELLNEYQIVCYHMRKGQ